MCVSSFFFHIAKAVLVLCELVGEMEQRKDMHRTLFIVY